MKEIREPILRSAREIRLREQRLRDGPLMNLVRGLAVPAPLSTAIVEKGLKLALV